MGFGIDIEEKPKGGKWMAESISGDWPVSRGHSLIPCKIQDLEFKVAIEEVLI